MATDIFRLSLGPRGEEEPDLQPGDLRRTIQQTIEELTPLAASRGLHFTADMDDPAGLLHFESGQMQRVLANLLENACRFTPRNGTIELRGYSVFWERRRPEVRELVAHERRQRDSRQPNAYRVDIRDCGPGVPAEHLHSIFEPYTSYSGSQDRAGSGLGLAICRMVISAHRGQIFATSSNDGAVFSFVLPFAEYGARLEPQATQDAPSLVWPADFATSAEERA
jgi:signal transduction histidine kinase